MNKKTPRQVSLADYVGQVLKNAVYEKGEQLDVIIAEAPDLPGCLTQGANVEEARKSLVDAIEVWLMAGLRSGEDPPVVNGCRLAITAAPRRPGRGPSQSRIKA
jgi:predicted RNase H-like HicB family nuclease